MLPREFAAFRSPMPGGRRWVAAAATWALAGSLLAAPAAVSAQTTFGNSTAISVPDAGSNSSVSTIAVTALTGGVAAVTVTLRGINAPGFADLDFLLVSPGGRKFILASDAGGFATVTNLTFTLSDAAGSLLPPNSAPTTGTWRPSNYGATADAFPSPAPAGPYSSPVSFGSETFGTVFGGVSPNGNWSLYVVDDAAGGGASALTQGWSITITTAFPTATAIQSSPNPSFTSDPDNLVLFTATVTSGPNPVTIGAVTFRDGTTMLGSPVALDGTGHASSAISALAEGTHTISATFAGGSGYATSSASLSQVVNNHTTVALPSFCNDGAITIPDGPAGGALATPYPSNVYVSGIGTALSGFTVSLRGLTESQPDDLDLLLVGPGGQRYVLMSDVGGTNALNDVTLTLSDVAANAMPDNGALATGMFKPTAVNASGTIDFPAPAPGGPYTFAAPFGAGTFGSVFDGSAANGTWSLYVVDDAATGGVGTLASGWCLDFAPTTTDVGDDRLPESRVVLMRARPDPMRSHTTLRFALVHAGQARLELFDASGRRVRTLVNGFTAGGWHEVTWNGVDAEGRDAGAGVFFARLHAASAWSVQRLVRLR